MGGLLLLLLLLRVAAWQSGCVRVCAPTPARPTDHCRPPLYAGH